MNENAFTTNKENTINHTLSNLTNERWIVNLRSQTWRNVNGPKDAEIRSTSKKLELAVSTLINTQTTLQLVFVSCESCVRTLIYLDVAFMQLVEACTVNACRE